MNSNQIPSLLKPLPIIALAAALFLPSSVHAASTASEPYTFKPAKEIVLTTQAMSDRDSIEPGANFNILISLKMQNDWHVYWSNPGGTGLPTKVTLKLPAGFQIGATRYPVPHTLYNNELDETSFVLPEESALIIPVKAPADLKSGGNIDVIARVSWLSCKENCIPGATNLSLSLPVVEPGKSKPANADAFKSATGELPEPTTAAEHLKLSARIDPATAKPGAKLTAIVEADIEAKMHMQSNKPFEDFLIPAVVFIERVEGFDIGDVEYPAPHVREDPMMGKMSEYAGKIAFKVPIEVDKEADKTPRRIRGVLQYQICSDAGTCFAPQHISFEIPVQMEGGEKPPAEDWAAATLSPSQEDGGVDNGASAGNTPSADRGNSEGPHGNQSAGQAESSTSDEGWLNQIQNKLLGGFAGTLLLAVMGGLILNVMPCVLPVVSLKALSFVRQAKEDRLRIFALGLSYCAGIMAFFGILAFLFFSSSQGWGELFQNPIVILVLAAVVTAFALSLFGVFTVFTPQVISELGQKAEEREGLPSAFFTGMLATILGTACTAPFLSAAVAAASKYPPSQGAFIFLAVGFGMALPFLALSIFPAWLKLMPRPGKWMETFEVIMGFLLLGTVVWLLYPLGELIGSWGLVLTIIWLLGVALAVWVKGRIQYGDPMPRKIKLNLSALAIVALAWLLPFHFAYPIDKLEAEAAEHDRLYNLGRRADLLGNLDEKLTWGADKWKSPDEIPWIPYDPKLVQSYVSAGYPVFVDFTASWCASCKTNLKTSINTEESRALMRKHNIVPFEADYSRKQRWMKEAMESYGRASVPVYLVFAPNNPDKPEILPEFLTPGIVADALTRAGAAGDQTASAGK